MLDQFEQLRSRFALRDTRYGKEFYRILYLARAPYPEPETRNSEAVTRNA